VVERRVDAQGGTLTLPGIQVLIPAGALVSSVRFRLERLQAVPTSPPQNEVFFIQTLSEREVVGIYRLSSGATSFLKPIEIELQVNPPYRPHGRVIKSVIYTWDGRGYVSTQVPSTRESFTLTRLELGLGAGWRLPGGSGVCGVTRPRGKPAAGVPEPWWPLDRLEL